MSTAHKRAAVAAGNAAAGTVVPNKRGTTSKGHDGAALQAARLLAVKAAEMLRDADLAAGTATDAAVDAVQAAYTSGLLSLKRGDGEMTGAEYVGKFFPGRAVTLLTYWTTLYLARDVVKVGPDTYGALKTSPVGGGSKPAQVSVVAKAVRDPKATAHKVTSALGTLFTTDASGNVTRKAAPTRNAGAASGAGRGTATTATSAKPASANVQAKAAVATLRKVWGDLTPAQRKAISNGLASLQAQNIAAAA